MTLVLLLLAAEPAATRWVMMDSVALRASGDAKSAKLEDLALGDAVTLLGETSKATTTARLRCKDVTGAFVKVKTAQGKEGWVFEGGLSAKKIEPGPANWRAVISFMLDPENASEDSTWFDEDIRQGCAKGKGYFAWASPKEPCAVVGDEKAPISVVDMTQALKGAKNGDRWMLIERKGREKTVKVLGYNPDSKDVAVTFCSGQ